MSLRTKITLALLVMSFAAIAVVGVSARSFALTRFNRFVVDRAAQGFIGEMADYYQTYGSWEAAREAEPFFDYLRRERPNLMRPGVAGGLGAGDLGPQGGQPPEGDRARRLPLPPGARPAPNRVFDLGGEPPPFAVTDEQGTAVLPLGGLQVGDRVPRAQVRRARPITVDGAVVGLAVARERPGLTELEERYLSAIEDSWLYALLIAGALAVPMGLVLGRHLTRPIQQMTLAMGEMEAGMLRQRVDVPSEDEVGQLAQTFNRMSTQLADAYEELEASRAQLDAHAQAMAELSRTDPLTGLYNRRAFDEHAEALLARSQRYGHALSMAMLDLDEFKQVNDDFSHGVGDQVLVRTAEVLTGMLRETDLVARYGGEEFVIAFPETSAEDATALAERIRERFERTDWSDLLSRTVTVSIGLAVVRNGEQLTDALARADRRLYKAKSEGRNRVEG